MQLSTLRNIVLALLAVGPSALLWAQDSAQWKFAVGDELRWEVVQATTMEVTAGDAGAFESQAKQTLDVVWRVEQVDDSGTMTGIQQIERIRVDIRQPAGLELVYDSQSDQSPEGLAAMLIPLFDTLVETSVTIQVTPQGEVTGGELPEEMQKRIAGIPATRSMSSLVSQTGVLRIAEQIAMPLPASTDDAKGREVVIENRILGTLEGELQWTQSEVADGVAKLTPKLSLTLQPAGPIEEPDFAQPKPLESPQLEEQQAEGIAEFDTTTGRLKSSSLEVNLTIAGEIFGSPVTSKMKQTVEVRGK